jgi:hypothetical protein
MPSSSKLRRNAYVAVCGRVMTDVMGVVRAQRLGVGIDIDPGHVPFEMIAIHIHKIRITYGRAKRVIAIDHDRFMSAEFFRTLVLPQVRMAIEELGAREKG